MTSSNISRLGSLDEGRVDVPSEYYGGDSDAPLDVGRRFGPERDERLEPAERKGSVHSARQTLMRSTGSSSDMIDLRSVRSNKSVRSAASRQGSVRSAGSRESSRASNAT